jgi:hypothetical protein
MKNFILNWTSFIKESKTYKGFINFRTPIQKTLWDHMILGQLSDGMWENTKPYDHWKFWHELESKVGKPAVGFEKTYPCKVDYNLSSSALLDAVGDEMIALGKGTKAGFNHDQLHNIDKLQSIKTIEDYNRKTTLHQQFSSHDIQNYLNAEYTLSNLKADLRDMAITMKLAGGKNSKGSEIVEKADKKDLMRIEGIIAKSKGDIAKEDQLTTNMANAITTVAKAVGRYNAAMEMQKPNIAKIFKDKAIELGWVPTIKKMRDLFED